MPRPLNDSPYLYGLHDPGGEWLMAERKVPGWILFTEELGADPNNGTGRDYSQWANQGFGIIVRLNHGYEPRGTLPRSERYSQFARRCANFVRASQGCHIWIIGNEPNYAVERPDVRIDWSQNPPRVVEPGEVITPGLYVNCFRQCRKAIKAVPGHENDQVVVAPPAPWNPQTTYPENPTGDWVKYLTDVLTLLGPDGCDGIAIHTYTHGADPRLVYTDAFMNPPFQNRQYNFRAYRDFMQGIPLSMRSLPVYLTETDQNDEWRNENNGWVKRAYGEIHAWNQVPGNQKIRAVILYRWPKGLDKWGIEGKAGVIEDFKDAMNFRYNWEETLAIQPEKPTPVEPEKPTPVEPTPDTSPITFPETGRTARGIFAAFYRKYGLDITGYPISDEYTHPDTGLKTQDWQRLSMEEFPAGKVRLRLAGSEVVELRKKISKLERQIAQLTSGGGGPAEPEITDITAQLPRDPAGFVTRPRDAIQYVIINHTGVRPEVGADRVAAAHRKKWPGIVGQYFVTGDGAIQQTNPLEQVVASEPSWIYNGINIYVAGNFDDAIPSPAQMEALAQLCAWLLASHGLGEDAIRGVSEFIVTRSPGLQWLQGQRWKDLLLEKVRAVPSAPPTTGTQPGAEVASLRAQIETLQRQLGQLQAQVADLDQRNALLQMQLEAVQQGGGTAAGQLKPPPVTDITLQLPRDAAKLKPRPADQIKYLVFNHSGVDPSVGVDRIAAVHQKRWGAILYQYFIAADGTCLQTNPLDQVVDQTQPWIGQAINIGVAGEFSARVPTPEQIETAAQLSAWLMQQHRIPVENLKGASEFYSTQSPGQQWLTGQKWKEMLLARIAEIQKAAPPAPGPGDAAVLAALRAQISQLQVALSQAQGNLAAVTRERDELKKQLGQPSPGDAQLKQQVQELTRQVQALSAEKTTLAGQVQTLTGEKARLAQQVQSLTGEKAALDQQVQSLTGEKSRLSQQIQSLNTEKASLAQQLAAAGQEKAALNNRINDLLLEIQALQAGGVPGPTAPAAVPAPPINDIVDQLPKHPTLKYATRSLSKITHVTIHHSAAPANVSPERVAQYHVNTQGWPGIGYHFYVDPEGTIYQTNRLETISYHVGDSNTYSVGICVAGTFSGVTPTPLQIQQTGHLAAWLIQKLNLKPANVMGHKEFPDNVTQCPGTDWTDGKVWKQMLMDRINQVLSGRLTPAAKTIGHYMLFWQRGDAWAKEDWAAAANYFARFRPTAGFSVDDAKNAEYVTIVGGVAGVPYEAEQALIAAGCKVERLAGKDFADTKRMLDDLAQRGRRFMTFNV